MHLGTSVGVELLLSFAWTTSVQTSVLLLLNEKAHSVLWVYPASITSIYTPSGGGSFHLEWGAGLPWNQWQVWTGIHTHSTMSLSRLAKTVHIFE